jgi:hypothetical protein
MMGTRVYSLAKLLGVEAADVLAAGKVLGLELKTQLSVVSPEKRAALEAYFREAAPDQDAPPVETTDPVTPTLDELLGGQEA